MTEFYETRVGRQFYERTMPELVRQLERVADAIERSAAPPQPPLIVPPTFRPSPPLAFQVGARVVIRFNPHHEGADDIVGEVTSFEPGSGFMGCDLAYVRYEHPRDGEVHTMPFSTANLEVGDRQALLARATRHDGQAAKLRAMADEVAQ